ncbi:MAG: kelch repeat-containing protein [Planctomycetota bacterium]
MLRITTVSCLAAASVSAQAFNWTLEAPTTPPTARERTATGTDGVHYFMYGGQLGANVFGYDELWSYDGAGWTLLTGSGLSGPGTRRGAVGGYDVARGKFVVFSGQDTNNVSGQRANDTWEWDPVNGWVNVTPAGGSPDGRWLTHNGVYVPGLGIVFHGGNARDAAGNNYRSNETWAWVGGAWVLLATTGPTVQNAMMEYRTIQGDLILHGGQSTNPTTGATEILGETWRYDFSTAVWSQLQTGGTTPFNSANPSQGLFAAMSYYNPDTGMMIVHGGNGGSSSNKTWQFDGVDWKEISTNGVGCRNGGMHWIAALGEAVYGPCNEANGGRNRTRSHGPTSLASTAAYGAGCAGLSGAPLALVADNDPWVGVSFSATCTNMSPASPLKLAIWGLGTSASPIGGVLGAGAGCTLLNTADFLQVGVAATSYTASLPLPATPSLTGTTLHLQAAEFDPAPSNLATSNGLTLTIGG